MPISRRDANRRLAVAGLTVLGLPWVKVWAASEQPPSLPAIPKFKIAPKLRNAAEMLPPSAVHMEGWLGARIDLNARNRLRNVNMAPLLAGFQKKPGSHPWIGEHVGKWMHAATLTWANNGDRELRDKLDRVATDLINAQEPDGYLGTYVPEKRFGLFDGDDWDVWSHKYCMIGLLTYYQYTGNIPALDASRKAADLLIATFPAKRSILAAGPHLGMAATSVLEPMVLLYRLSGEERYLKFTRYILKAWDEEKGPGIVNALLREKQVRKVANAKAYEMLSNLVGLADFARVTGEQLPIKALLSAWQDIVDNRLYVTGTTSQWEHFQADHDMRGDVRAHVGETCVTTTWIQFNLSLLQLTGEARFADELERSFYNHLSAAQHPRGDDWCYFTALEGRKKYDKEITCCHSSGPRGLALAPQTSYLRSRANGQDVLIVNTFESSRATVELGGEMVTIEQQSGFPVRGESKLTLRLARPARFGLKVRSPAWAQPMSVGGSPARPGWAVLPPRTWKDGDVIVVNFTISSHVVAGEYGNAGRAALAWGPFVLALEQNTNPTLPAPHLLGLTRAPFAANVRFDERLEFEVDVIAEPRTSVLPAKFATFADAGADRGVFRIWMRAPGLDTPGPGESLLTSGQESRSRAGKYPGNQSGSIIDEDFESVVSTFNGEKANEDWFAVTLSRPAMVRRIVFTHGKNFHDGGWFVTTGGKPRVQIQRGASSAWETIGELADYPATTAISGEGLTSWWKDAQFSLQLKAAVTFVALRVIGKPASGDNPEQAFVTCTQLQAFTT